MTQKWMFIANEKKVVHESPLKCIWWMGSSFRGRKETKPSYGKFRFWEFVSECFEWMNEWMSEWMNEQMNEWMNE